MLGLRSRLHAAGAALVGTKIFTDGAMCAWHGGAACCARAEADMDISCAVAAYFDTPSFRLTLADMWLRKRDGVWELKIPGAHVDGMQAPAPRYYASAVG
jgi:hypothetical protein